MGYLGPHIAISPVDTELHLKDKILIMFRAALPTIVSRRLRRALELQPIYFVNPGLCITNSRRDIIENMRDCLRILHQNFRWL